ncbi:MAG TPA: nucleotide exchange factor GrpE [Candidatus Binatia bacterium]|jgi:molecular chaperone GrpE
MADEKANIPEQATTENDNELATSGRESAVSDQAVELASLREQLDLKKKEASENYDRYLRQVAELENFKKRANREKDEAIRFANEALVKDLLPVADNLERALAHAKDGGNGRPLIEGVEMVLKGFFDVLAKHGVVAISAVGQPFDPTKHEAMAHVESNASDPNTVLEEYHKGYLLRDRLIRPALVSVAKTPKSQGKKNGGAEVENEPGDD